jgi:two-component system, NtrC family, sensor histidine kinase HydH
MDMKIGRLRGFLSLPKIMGAILLGACLVSLLFFIFWRQLNLKVELILREQFNQQQLAIARKVVGNVETYFDFLRNALLGYAGLYRKTQPGPMKFEDFLEERFERHRRFGILAIHWYDASGTLIKALSTSPHPPSPASLSLPTPYLAWARNPLNRGQLLLSKTFFSADASWKGRKLMRFLTPLYTGGDSPAFSGVMELLIDPVFISLQAIADVRSGQTGYAWIIDQDETMLAHHEKEFVGQPAIPIRLARNPQIVFRGLKELHERVLQGGEGTTAYDSGWHRQRLGLTPKLAAYAPVRFDKGLIRGVTDREDPTHNIWGVAVVAPVVEVSGPVGDVMHQVLFLVGLFFLMVLVAGGGFTVIALIWNKTLASEVDLKTRELKESHDKLLRSERFAAVGEAAAYVSHEIKNPLMVIGGMVRQLQRRFEEEQTAQEKFTIVIEEVKRLESFLGDLRDFTRPAAPVMQKVDLNQVIQEEKALMQEAAKEKGIVIVDSLHADLPPVEADRNQMKQVLVNLIKNAMEAIEGEGKITLATGVTDGQIWFSVQDTGKGIDPETLVKIFDPFFTTKDKGTGLGLAVINKIVIDHQGTIDVASTPEAGTTFTVRLPKL